MSIWVIDPFVILVGSILQLLPLDHSFLVEHTACICKSTPDEHMSALQMSGSEHICSSVGCTVWSEQPP